MTLTAEQREDLKGELAVLDGTAAPIAELMEPLRKAATAIQDLRDITLLRYGLTDEPPTCEACEEFVLPGDKYCPTVDGGPLCQACAPDFADMKRQAEEGLADPDDDDHDGHAIVLRNVELHLAAGGSLDDKYLIPFED